MDTLSSSVSSFKVPALPSTPRGLIKLRTPTNTVPHLLLLPPPPQQPQLYSTTIKPTTFIHNNNNSNVPNSPLFFFSPPKLSPLTHQRQRAAAGYAAALVDIAQSNNSLQVVQRDVRRFTKLLRSKQVQAFLADPFMDEKEKGWIVVKEMAEKGKFHRRLVALLKMMVEKTKLGLVGEVLDEFHTMFSAKKQLLNVLTKSIENARNQTCKRNQLKKKSRGGSSITIPPILKSKMT